MLEGILDCVDRYEQYSTPFKKKAPVSGVPSFEYGAYIYIYLYICICVCI